MLLLSVESLDAELVKSLVGLGLLLGIGLRLLARGQAQRDLPKAVSVAVFSLSGLLQGLIAMGGPPLVLWLTTRKLSAQQARAFTMTLFLFNAPVQVLLLLVLSRTLNLETLLLALLITPLIYLGTRVGLSLGDRFSKALLNNIALAVLLVIALRAIL